MSPRLLSPVTVFPDCELWIGLTEPDSPTVETNESDHIVRSVLNDDEVSRWQRYRTVSKKRQFLRSRMIVREVLRRMFPESNGEVRMISEPSGRPRIIDHSGVKIADISLSHSDRFVAVAVSANGAVGVDLESGAGVHSGAFASVFLTTQEVTQLQSCCQLWDKWGVTAGWVVKEAAWKAFGDVKNLNASEISIQCCHEGLKIRGPNLSIGYHSAKVRLFSVSGDEVILCRSPITVCERSVGLGCVVYRSSHGAVLSNSGSPVH